MAGSLVEEYQALERTVNNDQTAQAQLAELYERVLGVEAGTENYSSVATALRLWRENFHGHSSGALQPVTRLTHEQKEWREGRTTVE